MRTECKAEDVAGWQGDWPKQSPCFEDLKIKVHPAGNKVDNGSFMPKNDMNKKYCKKKT